MNWVVFHIVSGHAFFSGVMLVVVAIALSTRPLPVFKRMSVLGVLVGAIAIAVSSTAIPYWCYGIGLGVTAAWIVSCCLKKCQRGWARVAVACWTIAGIIELPYHFAPSLAPTSPHSIAIIGDSLTAGLGDDGCETWPSILARERQVTVQDIAFAGATTATALERAKECELNAPVVVVEIGGNDLLGSTTSAQFARDLDALLAHLAVSERQVVMFELPLPPFYHEFGRIQRLVSKKYDVKLVPKRVLLSVIADSGATLDSIHLSQSGHRKMADTVWELIQSAFGDR
jgi:acyl-CoA thioesterase I